VSSEFSAQQYAAMARLVPGSQLAGYVIEEQVGAGGMAVVFRARDSVLGRLAALKVLSPTLAADQGFRVRFLRESRAVASVEEPHIIPVYGAGDADGVLYIATKFVAGGDLADVLQRAGGALEPPRVAMFIEQVAAALDAAHAAGLVHRDVKPGNVLVDVVQGRGEHAYLSDFGLSKPAMAATGLTATGTFLGTPDYAPPEQIRGEPVDGRGDQYSLACMSFALLTGNLPFHRQETMATLFAHLNDPVPPLSRFRGDLPPGTDAVLARGLAKEARDRYLRCGEFAAALRDALTGGRGDSRPGSGSTSLPGTAQTRLESAPPGSRPPHGPETAVWPPTKAWTDSPSGSPSGPRPATELASPSASPGVPSGAAPSPLAPSWPWPAADAPAAAAGGIAEQPTWTTQPPPGASAPTPPFPAAGPMYGTAAPAAGAVSGYAPRAATPASSATPRPGGARPATSLPPPPPPAAGQGGKLPLIPKSAVIAALAAVAALVILILLHGLG
jgi:serine/threonine-protein kinase